VDAHRAVSWATAEDDGDCWGEANDIRLAAFLSPCFLAADAVDSMVEIRDDLIRTISFRLAGDVRGSIICSYCKILIR
jgi:hypothetical protein